jgi:hypothetical protein
VLVTHSASERPFIKLHPKSANGPIEKTSTSARFDWRFPAPGKCDWQDYNRIPKMWLKAEEE